MTMDFSTDDCVLVDDIVFLTQKGTMVYGSAGPFGRSTIRLDGDGAGNYR
jgi:hypothetical protein